MILRKNNYPVLPITLIVYAFFAFLTPLSSIFFVVLCSLIVLSAFLLSDSDILCFLAFSSCFMSCFNIESMFLKMFELVMTILLIRQLIVSINQKNKQHTIFICLVLAFCLISFIYGLILSKFHVYKLWQSFGIILSLSTIFILKNIDIKKVVLILCLGLITSSACSVISHFCGISTIAPFIIDGFSGFRFSGYFNYVNALALYCSLCQASLLTLFLTQKLNIKKWFWLLIVVTSIGLFTFSKSFISITSFTYVLAIILGFVYSKDKRKYAKSMLIGVVIILILSLIFNSYIRIILKRFLVNDNYNNTVNVVTTGRFDIWKSYLKHIVSSPLYLLFGCGITADSVGEYTPHNLFISILYRFGLFGVIVLLCFMVYIIKNSKITKHVSNYLPLAVVLINACFEDLSSSLFTCLPIIIAVFFILKNTIKLKNQ